MVLLIGNYVPDRQQSMQRFSAMMLEGLTTAGLEANLIQPEPVFGRIKIFGGLAEKWLGYIDKYILFPRRLKRALAPAPAVVHICDHSNAVYVPRIKDTPVVATCHDLLAVRGGLGEETDCPASWSGKLLQRWILKGLRRATAIACVSRATLKDAERLVVRGNGRPKLELVPNGLNYPYRRLAREDALERLRKIPGVEPGLPFVLHVGSNLRRKNREGVIRIFARCKDKWNGRLILAGDALEPALKSLGQQLGVEGRVISVTYPDSELLEGLYNCATALIYPSRFEGFGWPIAEAQACGCPVICSDREPLPEVAGDAGLIHPIEDEEAFAADILRLTDTLERERWSTKSLRNAERFSAARMIAQYIEVYRRLTPRL